MFRLLVGSIIYFLASCYLIYALRCYFFPNTLRVKNLLTPNTFLVVSMILFWLLGAHVMYDVLSNQGNP